VTTPLDGDMCLMPKSKTVSVRLHAGYWEGFLAEQLVPRFPKVLDKPGLFLLESASVLL
jgi:hypothetical protein